MSDADWVRVALCEVEDVMEGGDSTWREVIILGRKAVRVTSERVRLWFGGKEYDGLPEGSYRFDMVQNRLFDGDGDQIMTRNISLVHDKEFTHTI